MDVSLAGRFMVLAPGGDGVGVSKKLEGPERDRLRDLLKKMKTHEDCGLIARTAAQGASLDELERDVRLLEKLWSVSRGHAQRAEAPALVYSEPDLSLQMVRDDFREDVAELVIDDERQYHRVLAYVRRTSPELADRVKLYKGKRPLFQRYEIEQGIRSTLSRRVPLPSGGSLVFDYGEAFTVVDVNTGRFTGTTKKLEDTILKNNLEAAVEVVRQLRLRDIGGIIVVDFIDMASQKNRDAVLEVLQRELKKDRSKVYVVEISPLGLVEMTRKNIADGVREIMTCECPVCEGTGRILSDESLAIDMLRNLRRVARESKSEAFRVELEDGVARTLIGSGGSGLDELEYETGRAFDVVGRTGRAARSLRGAGRGHAGRDRRRGAALLAGRRAQPADARAAPLRRDRRRLAAQRRLRGAGHRRAALRRHDAAAAHRARDALRRAGRAARRRARAPGRARAPRPTVEDVDGEVVDKVSDILEPERRVGERLDVEGRVRRQKRRTQAEQRREQRQVRRRQRRRRSAAAADAMAAAKARTVAGETRRRWRGGREAAEPRTTEDGEAAAKRRRRRGGRGRRGRGGSGSGTRATPTAPARTATAEAVAQRRAGRACRRGRGGSADRPPRAAGEARPRQRRRRSGSGSGGARTAPPARSAPASVAPAPEATASRRAGQAARPASAARPPRTARGGVRRRARRAAPQRATRPPRRARTSAARASSRASSGAEAAPTTRRAAGFTGSFAMLPVLRPLRGRVSPLANRSKAFSVCRHLARRKAVPRPQGRVPDRRPPRARGGLDVLARRAARDLGRRRARSTPPTSRRSP